MLSHFRTRPPSKATPPHARGPERSPEAQTPRTRELVTFLSDEVRGYTSLSPARQQQVLQKGRARVDDFAKARDMGGLQTAAKLARVGDKVVTQAAQLGAPPAAAEEFLRGLGFVRPSPSVPVHATTAGCESVPVSGVPREASQAQATPSVMEKDASSAVGGRSGAAVTFECADGSVVAIGRQFVESSGASTLASMMGGEFADVPSEAGHWRLPSLTRRQIECFKDFCEADGDSLSGLRLRDLKLAASTADYLGCEEMEQAVAAELRRRLVATVTGKEFFRDVTEGLIYVTQELAGKFQIAFEMACLSASADALMSFHLSLHSDHYRHDDTYIYHGRWMRGGWNEIETCVQRFELNLMRRSFRDVEISKKFGEKDINLQVTFRLPAA